MPKTGDRVIVQGNKIGAPTRVGTLLKTVGSLIQVRWEDGSDSLFKPGAGAVSFESDGNGKLAKSPAKQKAAAKKAPAKAKPAAKKPVSATAKKKR